MFSAYGYSSARQQLNPTDDEDSGHQQCKKLFGDASRRRFDSVLSWSLDGFGRQGLLETFRHFERLASNGVGYRSFSAKYLDSCGMFKDAVLAILAVIAKQELVRLHLTDPVAPPPCAALICVVQIVLQLRCSPEPGAPLAPAAYSGTRPTGPPHRVVLRWRVRRSFHSRQ